MQTLNILFVLWVAVTNAYPMSVSAERLTNLEHKLDLMHKLVSPTTTAVTEADNLVTEEEEEPENKDVAEMIGPRGAFVFKRAFCRAYGKKFYHIGAVRAYCKYFY